MTIIARVAALLGFVATPSIASDQAVWPDLPKTGFISGKPATVEDAKQGNAAFSLDGRSKGALPLIIPQYVRWTDEQGVSHPMILVQAEEAPDGTKIVGLRDFSGQETVATLAEIELLGTMKPR